MYKMSFNERYPSQTAMRCKGALYLSDIISSVKGEPVKHCMTIGLPIKSEETGFSLIVVWEMTYNQQSIAYTGPQEGHIGKNQS